MNTNSSPVREAGVWFATPSSWDDRKAGLSLSPEKVDGGWKLNLQEVSEKLNITVEHLVEGIGSSSPASLEEAAQGNSVSVEYLPDTNSLTIIRDRYFPCVQDEEACCETSSATTPLVPKKRVHFEPSPIQSVYVYETTQHAASILFMDVTYSRPSFGWLLLVLMNVFFALTTIQLDSLVKNSGLSSDQAPLVACFWLFFGVSVLYFFFIPCVSMHSRLERRFLKMTKGRVLIALLSAALGSAVLLRHESHSYSNGQDNVIVGRVWCYTASAVLGFSRICTEAQHMDENIAVGVGLVGIVVMTCLSIVGPEGNHVECLDFLTQVGASIGSAVSLAAMLYLLSKIRNYVSLIMLLAIAHATATVMVLAVLLASQVSFSNLFSGLGGFARGRCVAAVFSFFLAEGILFNVLSYIHPVTLSLSLSVQPLLVIPVHHVFGEMGASYIIGACFLVLSATLGTYVSADCRKNLSVEVKLDK